VTLLPNRLTDEQELGRLADEANFYALTYLMFGGLWTDTS